MIQTRMYRNGTVRLPAKYQDPAYYFITICAQDRMQSFGECRNSIVCLSALGQIAYQYWQRIPQFHPFVRLHEFVVMPDHVHGIIEIVGAQYDKQTNRHVGAQYVARTNGDEQPNRNKCAQGIAQPDEGDIHDPECAQGIARPHEGDIDDEGCAQGIARLRPNRFGPQSGNIPSMIRGYKSAVKKFATTNGIAFVWQPRYWDRIIRDEIELARVRQYILDNPQNWHEKSA